MARAMCRSGGEDTGCHVGYAGIGLKLRLHDCLKELSHGIFSCFCHAQNYLDIKGNLKMVVH